MNKTDPHLPSRRALPLLAILVVFPIALACVGFLVAQNQAASQGSGAATKSSTASSTAASNPAVDADSADSIRKVVKTPAEWRKQLNAEQFRVARKKGTERAFTGKYWKNKKPGTYTCVCCDLPLFDSKAKFRSGTGWPSYFKPVNDTNVTEVDDSSWGIKRTEVVCSRCDAHLGHVFNDGPAPTGLRYCINSASLNFKPAAEMRTESNEVSPEQVSPDSSETNQGSGTR